MLEHFQQEDQKAGHPDAQSHGKGGAQEAVQEESPCGDREDTDTGGDDTREPVDGKQFVIPGICLGSELCSSREYLPRERLEGLGDRHACGLGWRKEEMPAEGIGGRKIRPQGCA